MSVLYTHVLWTFLEVECSVNEEAIRLFNPRHCMEIIIDKFLCIENADLSVENNMFDWRPKAQHSSIFCSLSLGKVSLHWAFLRHLVIMKNYSSAYKIARIVLTLICVILFVLQSYQQMDKFFSNMTSVSTSTMKDVAVRIPNIVVCLEEPFKAKKYPKSIEEFLDITYTVDEVFRNVPVDLQVASIATREGICYLLKRRQESDKTIFEISFKMTKDIKIYYVDKGQELCFIYGLFLCNVQLEASLVRGHGSDMIVTSKKFIHVPG